MILSTHVVAQITEPVRLSDYLIGKFEEIATRKGIKKAILHKRIHVNGSVASTGNWVRSGDVITLLEGQFAKPKDFDLDLEIPYEDDYFAVVVKPSGIPVSGNLFKTLYNTLGENLKASTQADALPWPQPVHRLDTATSGLVIVAKTHAVRVRLGEMLAQKRILKRYRAILQGELSGSGTVETPVGEKSAKTKYEAVETVHALQDTKLTLVDLYPLTGRTHQLRIHMASLGCPIVGDKLYRGELAMKMDKGLFLCAVALSFPHPVTHDPVEVEIPQPAKFDSYLEREKKRVEKYN
jgi:23S rRNA pseudouridine1911/1915/1917 synthase